MTETAPFSIGRRAADFGAPGAIEYIGPERRKGAARRVDLRARSLMTGRIVVGDCEAVVDCVIRNLSLRGARVRVPRSVDLPKLVGLVIVREGIYCEASVAWRRGDQVGLAFRARRDLKKNTIDPALRRVRALWSELAA